ncbi:MAG: hypothetical protein MUC77_15950 [Chromatiaceae bacterium]|jgi:hypothetical protein|nr:hypothetical protein [Chromatiaceae bacterium]
MIGTLQRIGAATGRAIDRLDARLRRWPVAGTALLVIMLVIGGTLWLDP